MLKIINVTQEHIDNGVRGSCSSCPLALAVKEAFPDNQYVSVADTAFVTLAKASLESRLPEEAQQFWRAFDSQKQVNPFQFEATFEEEKEW